MTTPKTTLEQSSDERLISYGIYETDRQEYKFILAKFYSMRKSPEVIRDFNFGVVSNDLDRLCNLVVSQGFAAFAPGPGDDPRLLVSFI